MEPYAYRENLESILAFVGGKHSITMDEALAYLGFKDTRAVHRRCRGFVGGWCTVETFAKSLCDYNSKKGVRRK